MITKSKTKDPELESINTICLENFIDTDTLLKTYRFPDGLLDNATLISNMVKSLTDIFGKENKWCREFEYKPRLWLLERNSLTIMVYSAKGKGTSYELVIPDELNIPKDYDERRKFLSDNYANECIEFLNELYTLIYK